MKHKIIYLIFAIVLLLPVSSAAQTNEFIYQGKLTDSAGTAANYDFQFRLCRSEANCVALNLLGTRTRLGVPVTNGVFSVSLDFPAASFDGAARFLEIGVKPAGSADPYTILAPRQQITSAPYAVKSLNAENADNAARLGGAAANQFVQTTDTRLSDDRNPLPNSANYIQNTTAEQPVSNFNVSGDGTVGGTLRAGTLRASSGFNINNDPVLRVGTLGNLFVGINTGTAITSGVSNSFFGASAGTSNTSGSSNSFFGNASGALNTTGGSNSFFGRSSGSSNTVGANNSFFGSFTGDDNTVGADNSFFGRSAGAENVSGSSNAFFGSFAGNANTTASSNSFFGASAGAANTTGFSNSFFGRNAGVDNTTGDNNAFFGANAGVINTTGNQNAFFGVNSGAANSTASGNSAFGFSAGLLNSTGANNSFFGANAGRVTTSSNNSFFGASAGDSNTTGDSNAFFGRNAGATNTVGGGNSFFGTNAGLLNTSGINNSFFGRSAGAANTTASNNSFFGTNAGLLNTTGFSNSFFGNGAGAENTTGDENSFFGKSAGQFNTGGTGNSFFGINAGAANISGNSNTFIGRGAGSENTNGSFNSFVGLNAGDANTSGISNSFFGVGAGGGSTTGNNNAFVGINAGNVNRLGDNNTAIGANANVGFNDLNFATAIGAGATVEASNTIRLGRTDGSDQVRTAGRIYANRGMQVGESGDNSSIFVYGNVNVGGNGAVNADFGSFGNLSKGGGSFKIDHPLDPLNKYLYHSFVESPDMMNIYNGNAVTDDSGEAVVVLPAYFEALNREFRYQLTVIGTFAQAIVSEEISANQFKIRTDKPNVKVSWQITGIRKDPYAEQNRIQTEVEKPENERGSYLYPKAYEQKEEQPQKP